MYQQRKPLIPRPTFSAYMLECLFKNRFPRVNWDVSFWSSPMDIDHIQIIVTGKYNIRMMRLINKDDLTFINTNVSTNNFEFDDTSHTFFVGCDIAQNIITEVETKYEQMNDRLDSLEKFRCASQPSFEEEFFK